MDIKYYSQVTKLLRRKGIDDDRILQTLNDIKGWERTHPDAYLSEHFGPPAALVRDMPKGNTIQAPQKVLAATLGITFLLVFAQIIFGMFGIPLIPGMPLAMWGIVALAIGMIVFLSVGGKLPENFRVD